MKLVRVKSYLRTGEFTNCEHIYYCENQAEALEKFRRQYPEHENCIRIAEDYDIEKNKEHFKVCLKCGCVH